MDLDPYEERDFNSMSLQELRKLKKARKEILRNNEEKLKEDTLRKWMRSNAKDHFLDFDEDVRTCDSSIDARLKVTSILWMRTDLRRSVQMKWKNRS